MCKDTFFDSGRKCVAMVTAYYTVKKYCGAGVLITFSDISSFISKPMVSIATKGPVTHTRCMARAWKINFLNGK